MLAPKRTRRATMPIPESIREPLYIGAWDLALTGFMRTPEGQWGTGSRIDQRHGLVILWMTALALRFSELQRLRVKDLGPDAIYVVRSKGGRSAFQSVASRLITITTEWRAWFLASHLRTDPVPLLPSINGGMLDCNVFNRDVCMPIGQAFGFPLSSHCFRDSACQMAYLQTASVRSVQALLGHQSVKTTEHYLAKQRTAAFQLQLPGA